MRTMTRREVRVRCGLSVANVGRMAGVTAGAVALWERESMATNRRTQIARDRLERLYAWLATAPDWRIPD